MAVTKVVTVCLGLDEHVLILDNRLCIVNANYIGNMSNNILRLV